MKCKYCNADIEQDAQFCPNCGKDLSKFNKCIKCGELLDSDTVFCPHCGTEQPHEEKDEVKGNGFKKWLLILPIIVLLVGAGVWFFFSEGFSFGENANNANMEIAESDTIEVATDIQSIEGIKARLDEILKNSLSMSDEDVIKTYFSQEFRQLYSKVEEFDAKHDEIGYWNGNIWYGGQDGDPNGFTINSVNSSTGTEAYADVKFSHDINEYHSATYVPISLIFENDNWYIDDVNGEKEGMKKYLKGDATDIDSSISFVNKIYKGSGNGGGIGTKMTISFLDNNKCLCESDWYQSFSSPKTYQGTYSIDGDKLLVRCKVDDTDYEFKFDVKSNGRVIEFNNSDPDVGGTMGNDIMSLELQ